MKYFSVCSGIECASVAWLPLGWTPIAFTEIDKFANAVLKYHYPDVPNLGDMTKIKGENYRGLVDILVGGTPCQAFSVAGLRKGLDDPRGQLTISFIRLVKSMRPRWLVWENVPGVLSLNKGKVFGAFLQALGECGYGFAYRILDAQYFGVPQRRRRVFVVGYLGDWRPPAALLFERHSLSGDTPPSRETGTDAAGATGSGVERSRWDDVITNALDCSLARGGASDSRAQAGFYVPEIVAQAVSCKWSKGTSGPAGDEHHNLVAPPLTSNPYGDNESREGLLVLDDQGGQNIEVLMGNVCGTLRSEAHGNVPCVYRIAGDGTAFKEFDKTAPLTTSTDKSAHVLINIPAVRRLTPLECERLMALPDNYTLVPYRNGKMAADTPRYKACGNGIVTTVLKWIGERINAVEQIKRQSS